MIDQDFAFLHLNVTDTEKIGEGYRSFIVATTPLFRYEMILYHSSPVPTTQEVVGSITGYRRKGEMRRGFPVLPDSHYDQRSIRKGEILLGGVF